MSDISATPLPRAPLMGAASLVFLTLCAVTVTSVTGLGRSQQVQAPMVSERLFYALDQDDGSIRVVDANSKELVERVAPGSNGFLRGTLRGLARERHREGKSQDLPFDLTALSDGRLTLYDPATKRLVDLGSFGTTNEEAFARLLPGQSLVQHDDHTVARAQALQPTT